MKTMEETLREVKEKAHIYSYRINTLPLAKRMTTILAQRHTYVEVERMKDQ
jgi:hypothetical protein